MLKKLVELLEPKKGGRKKLIHYLMEELGKSESAVYRRLKDAKSVPVEELQSLVEENDLGWAIFDGSREETSVLQHIKLQSLTEESLQEYIAKLWRELDRAVAEQDNSILILAQDIPLIHYMCLPDILCFRLFDWATQLQQFKGNYSDFALRYKGMCTRISEASHCSWYVKRPSTELWNECTLVPLMRSIRYQYGRNALNERELSLIEQALNKIIATLRSWLQRGSKDGNGDVKFELYDSYANLPIHILSYSLEGQVRKLITVDPFWQMLMDDVLDEEEDRAVRFKAIFSRSSCLNSVSEVEQATFFGKLETQVTDFFAGLKEQ
ncbi:hypothetical protein [Sphingobacterium pedocola]|uniref:WYL domain-containing protein n=1 Tax=Sphingobacterium pedocola TaxID=2082722 RepID=A0ABR9T8D5_9SPHI|nr:hypothetical protein [Sphingobacterium pedocola]MBE8721570.1 hypothetical protein [Sphingobacterium pedocola]